MDTRMRRSGASWSDFVAVSLELTTNTNTDMKYTHPFNLDLAKAGKEFGTASGSRCEFVAHVPSRREHLRLVVRDIHSDKLYSHFEDGRHLESSVRNLYMENREPAATKLSPPSDLREEILRIVREIFPAQASSPVKQVKWLAVWDTKAANPVSYCSEVLFTEERIAEQRARLTAGLHSSIYCNPRAIRVEL